MNKLLFDSSLCTGCRACELACSFACTGEFGPSKSRIRIVKMDEEGLDIPVGCDQCDDAPCVRACPVKAVTRDNATQTVLINHDICIGCKECLMACPFGAIQYDEDKRRFYKCELCSGDPECVKWCFTGAIKYTEKVNQIVRNKQHKSALKIAETNRNSGKQITKT